MAAASQRPAVGVIGHIGARQIMGVRETWEDACPVENHGRVIELRGHVQVHVFEAWVDGQISDEWRGARRDRHHRGSRSEHRRRSALSSLAMLPAPFGTLHDLVLSHQHVPGFRTKYSANMSGANWTLSAACTAWVAKPLEG